MPRQETRIQAKTTNPSHLEIRTSFQSAFASEALNLAQRAMPALIVSLQVQLKMEWIDKSYPQQQLYTWYLGGLESFGEDWVIKSVPVVTHYHH